MSDAAHARTPAARFHALVFAAGIGFGFTAPLTALFASALGASPVVAGLAVSSVSVSLLVVDFFGTRFVPRIDARSAMTLSLTIFDVALMILARIGQGFGAALFMGGALQLAVRQAPSRAPQAIGSFNAAWFAGVALGPLLSGVVIGLGATQLAGLRLAFAVCGGITLAGAAAVRIGLPPLPNPRRPEIGLPRFGGLGGRRGGGVLAQATLGQAVRSGIAMTMVPIFGHERLGLSGVALGVGLSALALTDISSMSLAGRLAQRHGRLPVLATALLWGVAATAAISRASSFWLFLLGAAAVGIAVGTTWVVPAAMAVDVAVDAESGLAAYRLSSDVGVLVGGVAAGSAIGAAGPASAFYWAAAVLAVGLALALAVGETKPGVRRPRYAREAAHARPDPAAAELRP
jgi:MFS family permease